MIPLNFEYDGVSASERLEAIIEKKLNKLEEKGMKQREYDEQTQNL